MKHPSVNELENFEESLDDEDSGEKILIGLNNILSKIRPLYIKLKLEEKLYARQVKLDRNLSHSLDVCINCNSIKNKKIFCCDCAEEISPKRVALIPNVNRCTKCQIAFESKRKF